MAATAPPKPEASTPSPAPVVAEEEEQEDGEEMLLPSGTDERELKLRFKQLAAKLHPDVNGSDDALEQFQLLSSEYSQRLDECRSETQRNELASAWLQLGGMSAVVSLVFGSNPIVPAVATAAALATEAEKGALRAEEEAASRAASRRESARLTAETAFRAERGAAIAMRIAKANARAAARELEWVKLQSNATGGGEGGGERRVTQRRQARIVQRLSNLRKRMSPMELRAEAAESALRAAQRRVHSCEVQAETLHAVAERAAVAAKALTMEAEAAEKHMAERAADACTARKVRDQRHKEKEVVDQTEADARAVASSAAQ
ncbi:MAG: hypothetical protein SGPRY_001854 [Prymnesium sp.]